MNYYHAVAIRSGDLRKCFANKTESQILTDYVIPFTSSGVIRAKWGKKAQSYQVLELRIYRTAQSWDRRAGMSLDQFLKSKGARNIYRGMAERVRDAFAGPSTRAFVIMPIQGKKYGTQDQQRVHREYGERFQVIEAVLKEWNCVAIRIDQEHPLDDLVRRIKQEIDDADFIVADLTDERPACYFEAGYAEALGRHVIYIASEESVLTPGVKTCIHFDVHVNVSRFSNHQELQEKLRATVDKNKLLLMPAAGYDDRAIRP